MKNCLFKYLSLILVTVLCIGLCACEVSTAGSLSETLSEAPSETESEPVSVENYYTVLVNANNGGVASGQRIKEGEAAVKPLDPTFGPHIFLGWYYKGEEYDWTAPVTQNITVNALWQKVYNVQLSTANGSATSIENGYKSVVGATILACTDQGFDRGTIEVTMASPNKSDSGIVVCLDNGGQQNYWEQGVSYYFFFVNLDGNAYLGKVDNGKWTAEKVIPIEGYVQGQSYRLKVILDGTDLYCYVDGKLYIAFSEEKFLQGTGLGLRAGAAEVSFTDFAVSGECKY